MDGPGGRRRTDRISELRARDGEGVLTAFALPDDAGIVRIYRRLEGLDPMLTAAQAREIGSSGSAWIGGIVDTFLLLFLPGLIGGPFFGSILAAAAAFGFLMASVLIYRRLWTVTEPAEVSYDRNRHLMAFGPVRTAVIALRYRAWQRAQGEPPREIDPTSLSVIEPVAQHLARPVLDEARHLAAITPDPEDLRAAERAEERRDELRVQARRETDPVWRQAAESQAERLDARAAMLRSHYQAGRTVREAILADARALGAHLDRLSERRRLLEEMRDAHAPLPPSTGKSESEEIRARLGALAASLRTQEALARDRAGAELEMREFERGDT